MENKLIIDISKCTLCGTCIEVCGTRKLALKYKKIDQLETANCILCGHCSAICPADAITVNGEFENFYETKKISENISEIGKILKTKRSVREFKDKEVDKKTIEELINYAEKSPSSSNKRKREYIVVTDKNKILELEKTVISKFNSYKTLTSPFVKNTIGIFNKHTAENLTIVGKTIEKMNNSFAKKDYPIFRNAPLVILQIAPTSDVQGKDDCIIAQQYMMIYAQSIGIGSTIIGFAQHAHKSLEKYLEVKKGYSIYSVGIFGYQKYKFSKEIIYTNKPNIIWH